MKFLYGLIMRIVRKQYWYQVRRIYPKIEEPTDEVYKEWKQRHPRPFDSLPRFPGW
jgi:hypothetical protein